MSLSTRDLAHRPAPRVGKSGFAAKSFTGPCFPVAADACICSRGCPTTACPRCKQAAGMGLGSWGCKRSIFCDNDGAQSRAAATSASALPRVTLLTFLTFRAAYVRNVFAKKPQRAYIREVRRIAHLASSVRRVGSRLPFHCVVAGDRNQTQERYLESVGVRIVSGRYLQPYLIEAATLCDRGCNPMSQRLHPYRTSFLEPPRWASKWHKQSFNKLGALAMTQFDKVIVLDNDVVLAKSLDELAYAETPSAVFHTAIPRLDRCTITTGLMVLTPDLGQYRRALTHLYETMNYSASRADGGDQEFWHSFLPSIYELPIRYHTHVRLSMSTGDWLRVHMVHAISQFAGRGWSIPKNVTRLLKYF